MFRIERFNFTVPSMKFSSGSLRLMNRKKGDSMRLQYIRVAVSYFILCILTGLLMLLIGNCFWHPNHACAGGLTFTPLLGMSDVVSLFLMPEQKDSTK